MERTFYLVVATFLGLAFSSCTNDVTDEMIAEASGKSSNEESEVVELNSGFTITKMNHLTIYEQSIILTVNMITLKKMPAPILQNIC